MWRRNSFGDKFSPIFNLVVGKICLQFIGEIDRVVGKFVLILVFKLFFMTKSTL